MLSGVVRKPGCSEPIPSAEGYKQQAGGQFDQLNIARACPFVDDMASRLSSESRKTVKATHAHRSGDSFTRKKSPNLGSERPVQEFVNEDQGKSHLLIHNEAHIRDVGAVDNHVDSV
jgi:hypothetical protein